MFKKESEYHYFHCKIQLRFTMFIYFAEHICVNYRTHYCGILCRDDSGTEVE